MDNAFVDDFFGNVSPIDPTDETHSVDLTFAAKWLNVRRDNLMKTVKASYVHGIDYVVSRSSVPSKGGGRSNLRIVMMTPDCFKTLCMRSDSPQSDRVRAYFISVEKTLFRYRAEIVDTMQRRIEQLERNQKPLSRDIQRTGVVYVIRASDGVSRVKLGRSNNLSTRLRSHGSASADALDILFVFMVCRNKDSH